MPLASVDSFDPKTNAWTPAPAMHIGRNGVAVAATDGKICAIGGFSNGSAPLHSMECLDPVFGKYWTHGPRMQTGRAYHGAAVLNDKLYVVGGWDGNVALDSMEVLDLSGAGAAADCF